jgi:hypothetical protein
VQIKNPGILHIEWYSACVRYVALLVLAGAAIAAASPHKKKHQPDKPAASRLEAPKDVTSSAAYRYGAMSAVDCEAELATRKIPFSHEPATKGVVAPGRLAGPLHGVTFKTDVSEKQRPTTPWEIADCRLVLALDDFAEILKRHDIVEVVHYSMYRAPDKGWPADKVGTRHNGALAIDAAKFTDKDGKTLVVDKDFHGAIGAKTCGDGAGPSPITAAATRLRAILCEAVSAHLFNVVLTPNYNRPHHSHFHLEVTEGVKWFLVH